MTADATRSAFDPRALRDAFSNFPSGVAALAAEVDGRPVGMAISSFTSVSLAPPLVSVCVDNESRTWPLMSRASRIGVSVLADGHDVVCRALAAKEGDRFADVPHTVLEDGAIAIDGASLWLDCSTYATYPAGDHQVVLLEIHDLTTNTEVDPLVFHRSTFRPFAARATSLP